MGIYVETGLLEDNETVRVWHYPCNQHTPHDHKIPWYTSGFE